MKPPKLLGISASPRNPWPGPGESTLVADLSAIGDKASLLEYIKRQGDLCLEKYLKAGRAERKGFLEIYANLRKLAKSPGLSNSELALAAALWSAAERGAEIRHVPLSAHFPAQGGIVEEGLLRESLLWADGILISGPVYFGDRSSLAKSLLDFIASSPELQGGLRGKLYGGCSVGAKRNGGQETTLIYQLVDMLEMGLLGVGNDSETTAQYGGTCHAGDVGTISRDALGLETAMGVGRRMATVLSLLKSPARLKGKPRALALLLQDAEGAGAGMIEKIRLHLGDVFDVHVVDYTELSIRRCMACDICPADVDLDEFYRCLVKNDAGGDVHRELLDHDVLIPVVVSSRNPAAIKGDYQKFMERTRYIRRGDYIWSDTLVAPVVIQEPGGVSTYPIRMLTSLIRHHTVMFRPLVGHLAQGAVIGEEQILEGLREAAERSAKLAAGRLARAGEHAAASYNPVGYVLSADKTREDMQLKKREEIVAQRESRLRKLAAERLLPQSGGK
ncbi:flavodoxin family protein [Fundidesulfovibrio agrisoli]|uniref:flavodoxin family protein n=1 Tax=Fundidesulfovibrio agrisoli TaxID=2922717 RepID=UPI001FAC9B5D|nr:NAD(P)H-dependent oxidoreductase [Fundidesulfovibrio agrisoli]